MQSTSARIAVALISVVAIVVLFVVFSGGDDESTTTSADQAAESTVATSPEDAEPEPADEKPEKPPKPDIPVIKVVNGEPKGGPAELKFKKGDKVRFIVASDVDEEIHVHGYDVYADVIAGKRVKVQFPANIDGIFEAELHGSGAPLAELRIEP